MTDEGNNRKCILCSAPIYRAELEKFTLPGAEREGFTLAAAWLAGFCSNSCMHSHAVQMVEKVRAWWQHREP